MTLEQQRAHAISFYRTAHLEFTHKGLTLITLKGSDYAPERIAMTEVFFTAAELGVDVPHILWVHCRKHMSAIAQWMATGRLNSEDMRSRLLDVANYMALIDSYMADPLKWLKHLDQLIVLDQFPNRTPDELALLSEWMETQQLKYVPNAFIVIEMDDAPESRPESNTYQIGDRTYFIHGKKVSRKEFIAHIDKLNKG